jgi:ribosomal protein L12E/L44/L45/RPP1/RPP2
LSSIDKELQQAKTDNVTPACDINARRKEGDRGKEEAHKKAEEDAHKNAEEEQSSKGLFPTAS